MLGHAFRKAPKSKYVVKTGLFVRLKLCWRILRNKEYYSVLINGRYKNGEISSISFNSNFKDEKKVLRDLITYLQSTYFMIDHNEYKPLSGDHLKDLAITYVNNNLDAYDVIEKYYAYGFYLQGEKDLLDEIKAKVSTGKRFKDVLEYFESK